jgi:hypothetical protein
MEKHPRDFKGVWIPKEIWLSDQLSLMEKVLFVEIHSLDNERGCFASNRHFADFFGISERQIRTYLASLKDKGFITISIHNRNERVMRAAGKHARVSGEALRQLQQGRDALIHNLTVWGRKKTSMGVGSNLPPTSEETFHRVIHE